MLGWLKDAGSGNTKGSSQYVPSSVQKVLKDQARGRITFTLWPFPQRDYICVSLFDTFLRDQSLTVYIEMS